MIATRSVRFGARGWRAEHLSGDPLRDDHPPCVEYQLPQLVRTYRFKPGLNPVEAQLRFAWEKEDVGPRRYECGAFIPRKSEADLGLVLAERDIHDLTDTELHTITHQHLAAPRQPRKHCSDVVDCGHASIMSSVRGPWTNAQGQRVNLFIRPGERTAYGT